MCSDSYWKDIAQCSREVFDIINKVPIEHRENLETVLHVICVTCILHCCYMQDQSQKENWQKANQTHEWIILATSKQRQWHCSSEIVILKEAFKTLNGIQWKIIQALRIICTNLINNSKLQQVWIKMDCDKFFKSIPRIRHMLHILLWSDVVWYLSF